MSKKENKQSTGNQLDKLEPDDDLKNQNVSLAVRGEEILKRMKLLEEQNNHILHKYTLLQDSQEQLRQQYAKLQAQNLQDRQKFKSKKASFEAKIKELEQELASQKEDYEEQLRDERYKFECEISRMVTERQEK